MQVVFLMVFEGLSAGRMLIARMIQPPRSFGRGLVVGQRHRPGPAADYRAPPAPLRDLTRGICL